MAKQYRKPHKYKKRKPIYRNRFFWLWLLFFIFLSSLFYFLFLADFFQIKHINLFSGFEEVPEDELNYLIYEKLESNIFFFPSKSIFLMNLNEVKSDILKKFPQIAQVKISRKFPDGLDVLVSKRKISAVFCQANSENQEEKCFAVDKEGVAYKEEFFFRPVIKKPSFDSEINLGEKVIEKKDLAGILEINYCFEKNLNIVIKEFTIFPDGRLTVLTEQKWEVYFSLHEDVKWQLTKLKALLKEKIPEEKRSSLEYIELRFGNFANPKYRD